MSWFAIVPVNHYNVYIYIFHIYSIFQAKDDEAEEQFVQKSPLFSNLSHHMIAFLEAADVFLPNALKRETV